MSLSGTLQVARTSLAVNQAAIQTHGNNIANAGDPTYSRQVVRTSATPGRESGMNHRLGTGVSLDGVARQVDQALARRLNFTDAEGQAARETVDWLNRVEAAFNELGDADASTAMSEFFNAWAASGSNPQDLGLRGAVISSAEQLADRFNDLHDRVAGVRTDLDTRMAGQVQEADALASQIAELNRQVVQAEAGGEGTANTLRDRRDALVADLSQIVSVTALEQDNGAVNVYVGSEPAVLAGESLGFEVRRRIDADGQTIRTPSIGNGGGAIDVAAGAMAGAMRAKELTGETLARLDALATGLAFEVNKLHASGQGLLGFDSVTSAHAVDDATVPLDAAGLEPGPRNGSFVLHLRDKASGNVTSTLIDVPLDGTPGGATLDDVAASIDAVAGVTASVANGRLTISADSSAQELAFGEDSSDLLATMGINTLFTGRGASDLAVSSAVSDDPRRLAASGNNTPGDGSVALRIAQLSDRGIDALGGLSAQQAYEATTTAVALEIDRARTDLDAAAGVSDVLRAQRDAISGVSLDEEAVALMKYQRGYQASARLIAAVDEMMQTLLQLV
jgi:flagellar hook-associated protein 1 FlgK